MDRTRVVPLEKIAARVPVSTLSPTDLVRNEGTASAENNRRDPGLDYSSPRQEAA